MRFNPDIHHRRSIQLKGYDYSQAGAYFVTICTRDRECLFGEVAEGQMRRSDAGEMIQQVWKDLPDRFVSIQIDEFIVMPNHIHGVIFIQQKSNTSESRVRLDTRPTPALGDVICSFKSDATHQYIGGVAGKGWLPSPGKLWHRNYYEHVIRNEDELNRIRKYIQENPAQWAFDQENPISVGVGLVSTPSWEPQLNKGADLASVLNDEEVPI